MSHWTVGTAIITDLNLVGEVAEKLGVSVEREAHLDSSWAGSAGKVPMLLVKGSGVAGVVLTEKDGEYVIQMDNYQNTIVDYIGANGDLLMHKYMIEKVKNEAAAMGGMVVDETQAADGWTELLVNIG